MIEFRFQTDLFIFSAKEEFRELSSFFMERKKERDGFG